MFSNHHTIFLVSLFSRGDVSFSLTVPTSNGTLTLPQKTGTTVLNGRQSKLIIVDYPFGASSSVLYTTASVFFAGTIGTRDVLFVFGDADQSHELALTLKGARGTHTTDSRFTFSNTSAGTIVSIAPGAAGLVTLWDSDAQLVLFADPITAATFWAPALPGSASDGLGSFWQFGTNSTLLVGGPNLVRNASLSANGATLALRGDLNASVPLTVIAPPSVRAVTWNGAGVRVRSDGQGVLHGSLTQKVTGVSVPALTGWKFADSLPEIQAGFDDSDWVIANHTSTNINQKPLFGDGRVLYGECCSEYHA